jgi:Putative zinc-finger
MVPGDGCCAEISGLLPEVALGIASGEDRAAALEHLSICADCRNVLAEISATADDLLELAPAVEPPAGFETRVLERVGARERLTKTRRRPRLLGVVAAAAGAAAITAVALILAYSGDHRLASQYRAALQNADGRYLASAHLRTVAGDDAGVVFSYQGAPSWLLYVVRGSYRPGIYTEQIRTRSGRTISLEPFKFSTTSWAVTTPVAVRDIAVVKLIQRGTGPTLKATLPVVDR